MVVKGKKGTPVGEQFQINMGEAVVTIGDTIVVNNAKLENFKLSVKQIREYLAEFEEGGRKAHKAEQLKYKCKALKEYADKIEQIIKVLE